MGILSKVINRIYVPPVLGSGGFPGVPAIPASSYTTTKTVCVYTFGPENFPSEVLSNLPPTRVCTEEKITVRIPSQPRVPAIPGTPGVPAKLLNDFQLGWNARAFTNYSMNRSGRYSFTVPVSSVSVVVGLTNEHRTSGFNDIKFGFSVNRGSVKIMELGQVVSDIGYLPNANLAITRSNGLIVYAVDSSEVYTSVAPSYPMSLASAMYSGGDMVIDAEFDDLSEEAFGDGSMAPLASNGGVAYSQGILSMAPMTSDAFAIGHGYADTLMRAMVGNGGNRYASADSTMLGLTSTGDGYGSLPYALTDSFMHAMTSAALGLTGGIGEGSGSFGQMTSFSADRPFAQAIGEMPPLVAYGDDRYGGDRGLLFSSNTVESSMETMGMIALVMREDMTVAGLIGISSLGTARVFNSISASNGFITQQTISLVLESMVEAGVLQADDAGEMSVWVLNMDAQGMTRYENYGFKSFAMIDGVAYGAKNDGIYRLEGADDAGSPIGARVNFGRKNFGSLNRKSMPYVYVGMAAGGQTVLKVGADGGEYLYTIRDVTEIQKAHRFELGRGLMASYYDFELQNKGGAVFDLASIEFYPIELKRKL